MTLRRSSKYLLVVVALAIATVMSALPASASAHDYGPGWSGGHGRGIHCTSYWVRGYWQWYHGHRHWVPGHWVRVCR
jgi:hypothetical protein